MIEAVLIFSLASAIFEMIVLSFVPPRPRLIALGSKPWLMAIHFMFLIVNLKIHWGTMTGSMTAIVSFIASFATVYIARMLWGVIREDEFGDEIYRRGILAYRLDEIVS